MRARQNNSFYQRRPFNLPMNPTPSGPAIRFDSDYDFQTANKKFQEAAVFNGFILIFRLLPDAL